MSFNIKESTKNLKGLQLRLKEESKVVFAEVMKGFFETFPEIDKIMWSQYTPYFNDGDPCMFSIGEVYFIPEGTEFEGDEADMSIWEYEEYAYTAFGNELFGDTSEISKDLQEAIAGVSDMLNNLEDFLLETFDDHVIVTINKEGAETSEYEHD